jgi:hypothetical protein
MQATAQRTHSAPRHRAFPAPVRAIHQRYRRLRKPNDVLAFLGGIGVILVAWAGLVVLRFFL